MFTAAPLLSGGLDGCADRFCAAFLELRERIAANRREICAAFLYGEDFGSSTGWSAQMADQHFHGRSSIRVDAEKGSFYYKPRDCRTDVLFGQIVDRWFSDIACVPDCVLGQGYAFCQNIHAAPASTEAEAGRYFRNLGGLCTLFQMFGTSDLHSENLVAQGVYPILVDMETILTPQPETFSDPKLFPEPKAEENSFIYDLNHSLFPSSILPALAGGKQYSILLDTDEKTCQLPVVDGKKRTVLGFEEVFLEGFSLIYDRCVRLKEELLLALHGFEQVPVRRLLRQSAFYGKLLEGLYTPSALRSPEGERRITDRLYAYFQGHGAERLFPIAAQATQAALEVWTAKTAQSGASAEGRIREEAQQAARLCFEQIREAAEVYSKATSLPEAVFPAGLANGYAGLLLVLCRFQELHGTPEGKRCIRAFGDRLLFLKTLQRKEGPPLWDTLKLGRPVSGMGHGMAGIAAALSRAYCILGEEAYLAAAQDALDFEYGIYSPSLGTWPDLRRTARPVGAMQGYCSGAPGVGLAMLVCLENRDVGTQWRQKAEENLDRALAACLNQELLFRDHLCCGNSAAVEFLLEAGRRLERPELTAKAGELFFSMRERAEKRGKYTLLPEGYAQTFDPSLFYGISGIGYELLRLAQPERIESLVV